jgi:hypothetical protein
MTELTIARATSRRLFLGATSGLIVSGLLVPAELKAADLSGGGWEGKWCSYKNGHNGPLKATFCRINKCQYEVRFRGRFALVVPFRYKETLDIVSETEECVRLAGETVIGPIMGSFSYDGTATATHFKATYKSRNDCGLFEMRRCC